MDILYALILGIVEGVTEFLPVSSTGHLILASKLFNIPSTNFQKSFEIIIQFGAILSVVALYWNILWRIETIKKLAVAFIPTGIIGLLLYNTVKTYLLGNEYVVLWALFVGGIALVVFELWHKEPEDAASGIAGISYKKAALIGLFQAIAIIPGMSRSASTIIGGLLLGIKRTTIVEFSFLLAVPTMLAASGLDLVKNASAFSADQFGILVTGFIASFIVALLSIKFLLSYIRKHNFIAFGAYRIIVAVLFFLIVL